MTHPRQQQLTDAAYYQPLLIRSIFESAMACGTNEQIVDRYDRRFGYTDFGHRVHALAAALSDRGVKAGDVVAVLDWDSPRYLEAYFAIPMMGAILQTVNPRLPAAHLNHALSSTGWHTLLCHADFMPLIANFGDATVLQPRIVILSEDEALDEYENLLARAKTDYSFVDIPENSVATLFHTSGTTGFPKAVSFTHRQLVLQTLATMGALGTQPHGQDLNCTDVYMPLTPMFHVHAWGLPYVATLMGLRQVYPGRYEPARIIDLKVREGVTFSHCVPTVLQMILDASGKQDFGNWKMVIGGSALPPALHLAAGTRGIRTFAGYGMSETGPLVSIARSIGNDDNALLDLVSAGHAVPLVTSRIMGPSGELIDHDGGAQGELQLRSPWLTGGYVDNDAASDELWRDGWLHTQDVASIGPNNRIIIRDRLKDLIKTGGEWVPSIAIEEILLEVDGVANAAAVGIADAKWGERPVAFFVPRQSSNIDPLLLIEIIRDAVTAGRISRYAVPNALYRLENLPLTSVGKIDKVALRAMAVERSNLDR
jgi:fatty-acyl-CoA synthase